VNEKK